MKEMQGKKLERTRSERKIREDRFTLLRRTQLQDTASLLISTEKKTKEKDEKVKDTKRCLNVLS